MSDHGSSHDHGADGASEDQIDFTKVITVGVFSLLAFAIGIWWAAAILHRETARAEAAAGLARQPLLLGKTEIGIVDQVPFSGDHRLADWRKERSMRLHSYGWVDRASGIAHIPIERALEEAAGGALPAGAPR